MPMASKTAYYKTRNSGTGNNVTQNTSRTAEHTVTVVEQWEHQGNTMEHQHNTSGTPLNSETINNMNNSSIF